MFEDDRYLAGDPLLRMAAGRIFSAMLQVQRQDHPVPKQKPGA